ncbi:MAG TPA: nucleoside-diphosphate kinase [Chthoniobacteraceae bacterium]|nr:nucleoside-diphosphate kinase [Chthoniobacteraceae bacterium]
MPEELSYVLITPGAVRKARTGGILSRVISRTGLELVRARMFAPSEPLVREYASTFSPETQARLNDYLFTRLAPGPGASRHALLLVFRGENAVEKIRDVAGPLEPGCCQRGSIRDTFGDEVTDAEGNPVYFEPALLVGEDAASTARQLQLWAAWSDRDGGLFEHPAPEKGEGPYETTLVLIKPDNFTFPSQRPGGVIDLLARTGLALVGVQVHHMSVAEASEFYRPVLDVLRDKFREPTGSAARAALEEALGFPLDAETETKLGDLLGPLAGTARWEALVEFMAGTRPGDCPPERRDEPGARQCVALIYQGVDAVRKIRGVLGPTDPSTAPHGTIRREYGASMMVNGAHASDSAENARREMEILKIAENNLKPFVEAFYAGREPLETILTPRSEKPRQPTASGALSAQPF